MCFSSCKRPVNGVCEVQNKDEAVHEVKYGDIFLDNTSKFDSEVLEVGQTKSKWLLLSLISGSELQH